LGIEPPPKHEISEILRLHIDRLPEEWKRSLNEIEILSRHLFEERSRAFYGDENELIPASELYGEDEAEKALKGTEMILGLFSQLLEGKSQ
jgi:HEPN domain-containing protein